MIVRPTKDGNWQILFESQQEAIAIKDYLDQLLVRGVVEKAEWQHEQETSTDNA